MTATDRPQEFFQRAILDAWQCAMPEHGAIYLAGPITTGLRYVASVKGDPQALNLQERVTAGNLAELRRAAQMLREQRREIVVEPGSLHIPGWSQTDYYALWRTFIERHARAVVFMPHWEYSTGSAHEFAFAVQHGVPAETLSGVPIRLEDGIALLAAAIRDLETRDEPRLRDLVNDLRHVARDIETLVRPVVTVRSNGLRKDASLDLLARNGMNVAQFVSFEPRGRTPEQAFSRISGREANERFGSLREALATLLTASTDRSINVRSYEPHNPQSREFLYGLTNVEQAVAAVERLTAEGLHTIANETIDVSDGGVSGVLMGNVMEFSPDDTPRCVEKPGTASFSKMLGQEVLKTVYGFSIDVPIPYSSRLEFSLHPRPRGWKANNVVAWEYAEHAATDAKPETIWPNRFSRMMGDKTFGLLVAHHIGLPVPFTTVVNRRVAPFSFGESTDWNESWVRTAPHDQTPGVFTTHRGWIDPFQLLQTEDPDGTLIASVLAQQGVYPHWSGALIVGSTGELFIEGRHGTGESLMLGESLPEPLPDEIERDVRVLYKQVENILGPVRFEWVHDGERVWIVQLHRGATRTSDMQLVPGDAARWVEFNVDHGLQSLRRLLDQLPSDTGLILSGRVGLTSHIADTIRKASVPTKMSL